MVSTRFVPCQPDHELAAGFQRVRDELNIPSSFAPEVLAEAVAVDQRGPVTPPGVPADEPRDMRDIEFIAIDPPGSRDIDQAFSASRTKHGYLVHYAIADLAAFVTPGGAIDTEAHRRGMTMYSPDFRASLHPDILNHGVASLLPGVDRVALVWSIRLDADGTIYKSHVERALVKNREAISYHDAQARLAQPDPPEVLRLLREVGRVRLERERLRDAVSLRLPSQEINHTDDGYALHYGESIPIERWNAQISLLTGIAAADIMIKGGTGILRTLPKPWNKTVKDLRRIARGLHIVWDDDVSYPERVRELDPSIPNEAAMLSASARGLQGAGYTAFTNGELPEISQHSAIASTYAHVTAPLRRLVDRYGNELVLAYCADREPPTWVTEALDEIPSSMSKARTREGKLDRGLLNFMEAATLANHVGTRFEAVVTGQRKNRAIVQILHPAVIGTIESTDLPLGERIHVTVDAVDTEQSRVELSAD